MTTTRFPNLYSIGAMRCATTSTHEVLNLHPEICMSASKEPMFWKAEWMRVSKDPAAADFANQGKFRSVDKYRSLFDFANPSYRYFGESSHYLTLPEVAAVIHRSCPRSKIIISLRDPIERMVSEYNWRHARGLESSLNEWVAQDLEAHGRVTKGLYWEGASRFVEVFGRQQVHFRIFDDLVTDHQGANRGLFGFLELEPLDLPPIHRENSRFNRSPIQQRYLKVQGMASRIIPVQLRRWFRGRLEAQAADAAPSGTHEVLSDSNAERLHNIFSDDIARTSDLVGRDLTSLWASD